VEFGGYQSPNARLITRLGADPTAPGNIDGVAPYARVAYQKKMGDKNVQVGAFWMHANIDPGNVETTGFTDHYTDLGLDASYQYFAPNKDVFTLNGRYTHESQRLAASQALGLASNAHDSLEDLRVDASYYWRNKVGLSGQLFDTWGSTDPLLYTGNNVQRPDSSGMLLQLDETPWGAGDSPLGPQFNLRVGVQYTAYFRFNGATTNFDGFGRNASDNNTLRFFAWVYY